MPFRYLEHIATADVAFEAWGESVEELFLSCGEALLATMVLEPEEVLRSREQRITLENEELDLLLFDFLNELVFLKDARGLLLHGESVAITEQDRLFRLEALASGERIAPSRHKFLVDIKAVTLHRFAVVHEGERWRATVVLDV
jgi:SHS2 domain-containing protein